jgi:UDP-N-acetylglucosamine/UDP-N-acetylgalactosamine diphosphorylase
MSAKVTAKTDDFERVGNLCLADDRLSVIEYSDFLEEFCTAKAVDGSRRFDLGNLAIHLLNVSFVDRLTASKFELPFHRAEKKVNWVDGKGKLQETQSPNAVKLEAFIFDALPLASNPVLLTVDRSEEFSPVKNAEGSDSIETATLDQIRRAARWLEAAGVEVPRDTHGEPTARLEIAANFALDAAELTKRARDTRISVAEGDELYLETPEASAGVETSKSR